MRVRLGIERIRPFKEVLGGPGHQVEIKRIQLGRQSASEFVARDPAPSGSVD